MGGHGGKLFIKIVQILIIFSLLIDEKRRKKRIIPKLPTSKPASIGVSARILLASGLPLVDARALPWQPTFDWQQSAIIVTRLRPTEIFTNNSVFFYRFKTSFNLNRRLSVFSCYSHRHKSILSAMASEVRDDLHLTSTGKGHYYRSPHGFPPQGFRVSFSLIFLWWVFYIFSLNVISYHIITTSYHDLNHSLAWSLLCTILLVNICV